MHTRISEDLDEALRRAAEDLRVPVSNLVRNLLEDAFDVVESVTESIGDLVDDVVGEAQDIRERYGDDWRDQARGAVRDARVRVRVARREARERARGARGRVEEPEAARAEAASDQPETAAEPHGAGEQAGRAERGPLPEFPGILGWQPMVLNTPQACAACGRRLARGERGYLGISSTGRPASHLCRDCGDSLS